MPAHDLLGALLKAPIQSGSDDESTLGDGLIADQAGKLIAHHHGKMWCSQGIGSPRELQWLARRAGSHLRIDIASLNHAVQYDALPLPGRFRMVERIVGDRRLGDASKQGAFGQAQFADGLAEISPSGRIYAVGEVAKVQLIQVQGQDFVLGHRGRQANGQPGLPYLAHQGLLVSLIAKEQLPGDLLRNGAPA